MKTDLSPTELFWLNSPLTIRVVKKRYPVTDQSPLPFKELRLLIVDNNPFERELLTFVFEKEGAEVVAVDSVDEAVIVLECFRPNLLISEINLPMKSGYSLLLQIRNSKSEQIAQIPAIALTTAVTQRDQELARLAGFNQHITKPADLDNLLRAVASIFRR